MAIKVAGNSFGGEKLVGNIDFFTVTALIDIAEVGMPWDTTGVTATIVELVDAGELSNGTLSAGNSITINFPAGSFGDLAATSVTYTTNATYLLAHAKQANQDLLVEAIGTKAQPILMGAMDVSQTGTNIFWNNTKGSTDEIGILRFAVEHTGAFAENTAAADSKAVTLASIVDGIGNALRVGIAGEAIYDVGGQNLRTWQGVDSGNDDNFNVVFAGTL